MKQVLIVLSSTALSLALAPARGASSHHSAMQASLGFLNRVPGQPQRAPGPAVTSAVDFSGTPTSGPAPLVVSFADLSNFGPTSWKWDFGDGTTSTAQNPTHVYNNPGAFSVKLKAAGPDFQGAVTKSGFITVTASKAEFAPVTVTVVAGSLKAGDASSVAAADGVVLKIKSVMLDGSFGDIVQYDFNTSLTSSTPVIAFAVIQRASVVPQQEQLSVFNFSTGVFDLLAVGSLSIPVDTITTLNITNPVAYISSNGEVRLQVRVGDSGTTRWKHLVDEVSLTAGP